MAAKGTESKISIFSNLQKLYPNSFWEDPDKILRIPMEENGETIEIKVSLTAAKVNLQNTEVKSAFNDLATEEQKVDIEPTAEEKANIETLLKSLNM